MTTTPSQRARELLAEVIGDGMTADDLLHSDTSVCFVMEALAAIESALRLPAGEDSLPDEWREFANKTSVKAGPATAYRHCADMLERRLGGAK